MEIAQKLLNTRKGTLAVAGGAALLAVLLIAAYVSSYKQEAAQSGAPAAVLVAKAKIAKGTSATAITTKELYEVSHVRYDQLATGAIVSPAALAGVAARDILPGEQMVASSFTTTSQGVSAELVDHQRAVAIPFDQAHGIVDKLAAGDRVDVYAGFNVQSLNGGQGKPVLKLVSQDLLVIDVVKSAQGGQGSAATVVLRARDGNEAGKLAFTADNGKLWLVLRPVSGAKPQPNGVISVEQILFGVKPITGATP